MFLHAKLRWLPAFDRVAFGTFTLARSGLELPFMRIGVVAICALRKGQRFLEVTASVAIGAANFQMHSKKREFCF